jgi:hypothetical protein
MAPMRGSITYEFEAVPNSDTEGKYAGTRIQTFYTTNGIEGNSEFYAALVEGMEAKIGWEETQTASLGEGE